VEAGWVNHKLNFLARMVAREAQSQTDKDLLKTLSVSQLTPFLLFPYQFAN
jgi:hypothetical protein